MPAVPSNKGATQSSPPLSLNAWVGPLPPPDALEQFNQIIPNGAERIMKMCEDEQKARIANDRRESWLRFISIIGGKFTGVLALLACIFSALASIYIHADWRATVAFLGLPVLTAIGYLLTGAIAPRPPKQ
jgi:uncharacterized membrane protein